MSLYAVRGVGARALLPRDLFGRGDESPRRVTDNDFFWALLPDMANSSRRSWVRHVRSKAGSFDSYDVRNCRFVQP